jgi:hypothetical protein
MRHGPCIIGGYDLAVEIKVCILGVNEELSNALGVALV